MATDVASDCSEYAGIDDCFDGSKIKATRSFSFQYFCSFTWRLSLQYYCYDKEEFLKSQGSLLAEL